MTTPIVFISHSRVKKERLADLRSLTDEVMAQLERDKPETLTMLAYLDEDDAELSILHLFGDAAGMNRHFEGAAERGRAAYELMEPLGWEIYGSPSEAALTSMQRAADAAGVTLRHDGRFAGGFVRVGAPQQA